MIAVQSSEALLFLGVVLLQENIVVRANQDECLGSESGHEAIRRRRKKRQRKKRKCEVRKEEPRQHITVFNVNV